MWVMGISKHPPRAESSPWGDQFLPPARREPRVARPRQRSRGAGPPGSVGRPGGGRRAEPAFLLSDASEPTQVAHVA